MTMPNNKRFSPAPLALRLIAAAVFCAAPVAPAAASDSHAATQSVPAAKQVRVRHIKLSTDLVGGKMVFLDEKGQANPRLRASVGDTIEIRISSGEGAQHDIVFPQLKVASAKFDRASGATTVRFKVTKSGEFEYFCSIAGHRQIGMEGVLEVTSATAAETPAGARTAAAKRRVVPSVAMDPAAVPAPLARRALQLVKYRIETVELVGRLDDNTTFTYWTFDRKVPGPMLRVRVGDSVELTLANARDSKMVHSIDLHAVTGPGGGAHYLQVAPGEEKTITFKALNPGLYVYHCATPLVPEHISAGMYGMILVEPEGGLPKVDREFYVMQGDLYTKGAHGAAGHQPFSTAKLAAEQPDYYVFNGSVGALTKEHKMQAKVGETVRFYFGVGGPNKISSFHVIGEIFDRVYSQGATNAPQENVQTTLVAPGGAAIVEFKVDYPGKYMLVDHALSRAGKGLVGVLEVTGKADPAIYVEGEGH